MISSFKMQWFDIPTNKNIITFNMPEPMYSVSRVRGFVIGKYFVGVLAFRKVIKQETNAHEEPTTTTER